MEIKSGIGLQEIFFFFVLIVITVAFYNILAPFIGDIFLSVILLILFKRPYHYFARKLKNRNKTAALLTVFLVILLIVVPVFFIGLLITNEVANIYEILENNWPQIRTQLEQSNIQQKLQSIPLIGDNINELKLDDFREKINSAVTALTKNILILIQNTFTGLLSMLIHTFVVIFLLYYLFIDGEQLLKRVKYLIPIKEEDERELLNNIKKVTDAIVFNSFMIGIAEGIFGGVLFAILGVPSPVFWGVIMAFLSIIPLVGTNTVMIPMAVYQIIIGNTQTGVLILSIGTVLVLINQNLIRPRLDGNKSGMHTAIMFLASLGGLMWFGVVGFLAGPLITALFLAIWNQYGKKYQHKLEQLNSNTDAL